MASKQTTMEGRKAMFMAGLARRLSLEEARKEAGISRRTAYYYKKSPTSPRKTYHRRPQVVTGDIRRKLMYSFKNHPERSFREVARKLGISKDTVRRFANVKGFKSVARRKMPFETQAITNRRLVKASKAIAQLKKGRHGLPLIFSDEKIFVVDRLSNSRHDRLVIQGTFKNPTGPNASKVNAIKFSFKTKHPAQVMMLGVVREDGGKCPPIFVPRGETLNAEGYIKLLKKVKLWADSRYGKGGYIFTQDGARPHTAQLTTNWLEANMPGYWGPDKWPPNSPHINPLDKAIWAYLQSRVNSTSHPSVNSLKKAIKKQWSHMPEENVRSWCQHFRRDLESLVNNEGSLLKQN